MVNGEYVRVPGPGNPIGQFILVLETREKVRGEYKRRIIHAASEARQNEFDLPAEKRSRSHGCVRVKEIYELGRQLLRHAGHEPALTPDDLDREMESFRTIEKGGHEVKIYDTRYIEFTDVISVRIHKSGR